MTEQTPLTPTVRHDGWTPERKLQFLDYLANEGSVRAACARVGMSREAAYRLRRRDALFARGWNAALVLARDAGAEVLANRATDGIEEEIWYRGELVGTRRKYDSRLLLAHMARLDRLADDLLSVNGDAARFDELLALVGGETPPEALAIGFDGLPLDPEEAQAIARETAGDEWDQEPGERADESRQAACLRAAAEAAAGSAEWLTRAHARVDRVLAAPISQPGTVSNVSTSPGAATYVGPDGRRYAHA